MGYNDDVGVSVALDYVPGLICLPHFGVYTLEISFSCKEACFPLPAGVIPGRVSALGEHGD